VPEFNRVAQDYIDVWNETDADKRAERASRVFSDDVLYSDPLVDVSGLDALLATIAGAQQQFPDFAFRLGDAVDGHHQQMRFTWYLGPDGQDAPIVGFDVVTLNDDHRICQVLGFLDRVPA
jgi:hypothetical protein